MIAGWESIFANGSWMYYIRSGSKFFMFVFVMKLHSTGSLRHNSYYWSLVNTHWFREQMNQHRWSFSCMGILNGRIIGLHFFEQTINGEIHLDLLRDLSSYLEETPLDVRQRMWFQHGGVPAHHYRRVRRFFTRKYRNRQIIRDDSSIMAFKISMIRAPDFNPLDSYFWKYVKERCLPNCSNNKR